MMAKQWVPSGMANRFKVDFLDGTSEEVTTIPGDAMAWERLHKKSFQDSIGTSSLLWTAWRALRREQRCDVKDFEAWADTIADFAGEQDVDDEDEDDAEAGPTRPALWAG